MLKSTWTLVLGGSLLTLALELMVWSFVWKKKKKRSSSHLNLSQYSQKEVPSPLHHLDFSKLKPSVESPSPFQKKSPHFSSLTTQSDSDNSTASFQYQDQRSMVFQIVLTGGPSGGKSSTMLHLDKILREEHGFDVYLCPEVPTLLLNAGCRYPGLNGQDELVQFEISLVELQLQMELSFLQIATSTGRPSVILYDRGLLDFAAYTPSILWAEIMNCNKWVSEGILQCTTKYDLILHMESASRGAERFFGRNGGVTSPTVSELEEARSLDKRIYNCWRGHPHWRMVDNSTDFSGKMLRATRHVLEVVLNHRLLPANGVVFE